MNKKQPSHPPPKKKEHGNTETCRWEKMDRKKDKDSKPASRQEVRHVSTALKTESRTQLNSPLSGIAPKERKLGC